ncbi:MAG: serine/threonine-protein kinase [Phototrophicaceae bacterium]
MNDVSQHDDLIGKKLGQFTILNEIGRGGMATVYRASQESINRDVALKVLPPSFMHDTDFYERFVREVEIISHLEHPHIVPIYDYGLHNGMPYIAMRLLTGGTLSRTFMGTHHSLKALIRPLSQVASALDYAHAQGIIHRDLKPGNILLDEAGNAYLSDFGIAKVNDSQLTGSAIIGTPAYMSPEQANGTELDGRSDQYSLGIVMFQLITGREPFEASTPIALILKHLNEPMPNLSKYRDDIPDEVEGVLERCTSKDPNQRYDTVGEMVEAFADGARRTPSTDQIPAGQVRQANASPTPLMTPSFRKGEMTDLIRGGIHEADTLSSVDAKATTPIDLARTTRIDTSNSEGRRLAWIYGWVTVASIVAMLLVGGLMMVRNVPIDALQLPTPFEEARTLTDGQTYSITIPDALIPPTGLIDRSDATRLVHAWGDENLLVTVNRVYQPSDQPFEELISAYVESYYTDDQTLIDATSSTDGIVRRSYRLDGSGMLKAGQLDAFFVAVTEAPTTLAVIELYTSDENNQPETVALLQSILDSVHLLSTASTES